MGILKTTLLLTAGRLAGACFTFFVPVFVTRHLDVPTFATYKLATLMYVSALMLAHVGMDHGLFYFMKKFPSKRSLFSLNAMGFKVLIMLIATGVGFWYREPIGEILNNPQIPGVMLPLCVLSFFGVLSSHLDHYFIVLNRNRFVTGLYVVEAMTNAVIVIGGFYLTNSLPLVLLGLSVIGIGKFFYLLFYNIGEFNVSRPSWRRFEKILLRQIQYSLPLGVTNLLTFVMQFDRYVISAIYAPARFAVYAVGCLELPVLPGMINTLHDLMSIEMVEALKERDLERVRRLWLDTVRQILFFLTPTCIFMFGCSDLVIETIFSKKYAESAAYFEAFILVFFFFSIDPELLFRVFSKTKALLKIQVTTAVVTVASFVLVAYYIGPLEALFVRALAEAMNSGVKLLYIRGLVKLSWQEVLPFGYLAHQAVIGVVSVLVIQGFLREFQEVSKGVLLPMSMIGFAAMFLGLGVVSKLITTKEIQALRAFIKSPS